MPQRLQFRHGAAGTMSPPFSNRRTKETGGSYPALAAFRAAFPATIPVLTGFLCLGPCLRRADGDQGVWPAVVHAHERCGLWRQHAVCGHYAADHGVRPLQAFLLSVMVNARHIFYGLSLLDKYKGLGKVRAF